MMSKSCVTYRAKFKRSMGGWEVKSGDDPLVYVIGRGRNIVNAISDYQKGLMNVSSAYGSLRA